MLRGATRASDAALTTPPPLFAAEEVEFSYGHQQVLFGVSLHVGDGEAVTLLGTNGAGKSTLLRCAAGLERPSAGRIMFAGEDVTGRPADQVVRSGLVLVNGGHAVFGDMTVEENLEIKGLLVGRQGGVLRERMGRVFDTFPRLAERRSATAGTLSGGERQQLALAKALLLEPRLLCIDELSLGLAPVVVQGLLDVVRDIVASGIAVLLVEQSLNIAAALCERSIFLEKGEVRFEGPTARLLEDDEIARAVFLGGKA
jgi:ABC-type branched-subunit amino acid transport system ATPase component